MSLNVNREEWLHQLESVQPGLSTREIIEQSSCFVFVDGHVCTYNDEIACRAKSLANLTGAVPSAPLLSILRKLTEDEVGVEETESELVIIGKRRRAGIRREAKVLLPVDKVDKTSKWKPLHEDFVEGVNMVQHCAGHDISKFATTCLHIHPKWVEACDNFQATRYRMDTHVESEFLVRRDSIKHIVTMGMVEFCETSSWVHFRNPAGLVFACRRSTEGYPDIKPLMSFEGMPITLPKGLGEAADKANVFSADNAEDNQLSVELKPGALRLRGEGASGWFEERRKVDYDGAELRFLIAPSLLIDIVSKHNEAEITEGRLRVNGGKWRYVTVLSAPDEKAPEETADEPETTE